MNNAVFRGTAGPVLVTVAGGLGLLVAQAAVAASRTYLSPDSAPAVEGVHGDASRPLLRLTMLGDSTAAGVGVTRTAETVGARLAAELTDEWQVVLSSVAVSGSRTSDLGPQVSRALLLRPDVAVILVGANDATHCTPLRVAAGHLTHAVRRLRDAGVAVVVGTCPDMGARAFAWPLREVVAWQGRRVARACAIAVHEADGGVVPLGELCGPLFRADPSTLSTDDFHPSATGYQLWCDALAPAVRRAAALQATL